MMQRVITVSRRSHGIDDHTFNLDNFTTKLNADGWFIKQIVSTSFKVGSQNGIQYPVIAVTLLIEKEN